MEEKSLIEKIKDLKNKKKAVILAHNYQIGPIQEIADFVGDSLELAKISKDIDCKLIVFCGVTFMAETAKILSPYKKVLLPVEEAGCPLADTITKEQLIELKEKHKDAAVVSYVNTSALIKAESDVCCTSANAVKVVQNLDAGKIIFVPDKYLGHWVQKHTPSKDLIIWQGSCYVHAQFRIDDLEKVRNLHPDAEILAHPECNPKIQDSADFVLSTSGMLKRAKVSPSKKFIIGTEAGLIYRLKKENPQKEFYSLGSPQICVNMKKTTLKELGESLEEEKYEIHLEENIIIKAKQALEEMVKFV